jgi:8-oxo-dGTP pyrophosphatase MutT (NUDIX family)
MGLREAFIIREESDGNRAQHAKALEKTGFWGKEAAGALFVARDTGRLLVAQRSQTVQEPGTWGTWGGAIDQGEDPADAVRREASEEAGVNGRLELVPVWTFKHSSGFQYHNFLAVVDNEFDPRLDHETQGFKWVEYGQWPQPMHPGLKELARRPELASALKRIAT